MYVLKLDVSVQLFACELMANIFTAERQRLISACLNSRHHTKQMDFTIPCVCLVSYRSSKTSKCQWIITRRPEEKLRRAPLFFNRIFNNNSNITIRSEESDLQSATKLVATLCPKGPLWGFANLKRRK